ncbi:MAG: hypothetical protein HQK91_01175 [Nitrospirae bacterium]|nr:hypothetical protein [Nitrospirota bacterium]MBF0540048.1 hypothetical protein [Nitrospirota bacterium]
MQIEPAATKTTKNQTQKTADIKTDTGASVHQSAKKADSAEVHATNGKDKVTISNTAKNKATQSNTETAKNTKAENAETKTVKVGRGNTKPMTDDENIAM